MMDTDRNCFVKKMISEKLEVLFSLDRANSQGETHYGFKIHNEVTPQVMNDAINEIYKLDEVRVYRQAINHWALKELVFQKTMSRARSSPEEKDSETKESKYRSDKQGET